MKHLRVIGLAVAAVATVMAFTGTASGTVLCANNTQPCTSPYGAGTKISASINQSSLFKAGFAELTCTESTLSGSTSNAGGPTEPVYGLPAAWTTGGCGNATVDIISMGSLAIHHIAGTSAGTLKGSGSQVTTAIFGVSCVYGTTTETDIGKLRGSSETGGLPRIEISASMPRISGGFLCANPAQWSSGYTLTSPTTLNVKAS